MKKRNLFFTAIMILAVIFSGCSNMLENTEKTNSQGVRVRLNIGMGRTVVPSGFLNAKYTLTGTHGGESTVLAENKTASELQTLIFWLESGTWSFTLDAYVGSTKKGTASISNKTISSTAGTLLFTFSGVTFDYASGTGGTSVSLNFPKTAKAASVTARLYNADGTENTNFTQVTLNPTEKDNTLDQVTYTNSSISAGSYLLVFKLYQDTGLTAKIGQWNEIVNIANGCESAAVISMTNLNTLYSITYTLNGLEWEEGFSAPSSYNACQGVVLPAAVNFRNGTGFDGWYTTSDCTGTAVTRWNAGDYAEDLKFYAKITGEAAAVNWTYPTSDPVLTWTGEGTVNNPYVITTAQQLADLSYMVNKGTGYSGNYIKLGADIDLNYGSTVSASGTNFSKWTPIGSSNSFRFEGRFDGNYHTIKGIYLNGSCSYAGLFGYVGGSSCEVKNLCVQGYMNVKNASYVGGITGCLENAKISNCANKVIIISDGDCGGIVGDNSGTVSACANFADIKAVNTNSSSSYLLFVGGICGNNEGAISLTENYGNITAEISSRTCYVGGITGGMRVYNARLYNSISFGSIKGKTSTTASVGGIFGYCYSASCPIENNAFCGTVDASGTDINLKCIGPGYDTNNQICNYSIANCGTTDFGVTKSIGTFTSSVSQVEGPSLSYTGTLLEVLNAHSNIWQAGSNGWPVLKQISWAR